VAPAPRPDSVPVQPAQPRPEVRPEPRTEVRPEPARPQVAPQAQAVAPPAPVARPDVQPEAPRTQPRTEVAPAEPRVEPVPRRGRTHARKRNPLRCRRWHDRNCAPSRSARRQWLRPRSNRRPKSRNPRTAPQIEPQRAAPVAPARGRRRPRRCAVNPPRRLRQRRRVRQPLPRRR